MASEKELGLARGDDKGEPLLPAPTLSQHSTPTRPTWLVSRPIQISLALLALVSLYWQYGPAITLPQLRPHPPAHPHAYSGEAAYARRVAGLNNLDQSLFSSPLQRHKHQQQRPLSYAELKETLLSVPTPESAKAASRS